MNDFMKWLKTHWAMLSIMFTIASSLVTGLWALYNKIDSLNDKVNDTASWVQDHEDDLKTQHDSILILKEDERLRELGLLNK